ncbi:unnamed protein product, partial [Discosporangium mesarthrocarpum]
MWGGAACLPRSLAGERKGEGAARGQHGGHGGVPPSSQTGPPPSWSVRAGRHCPPQDCCEGPAGVCCPFFWSQDLFSLQVLLRGKIAERRRAAISIIQDLVRNLMVTRPVLPPGSLEGKDSRTEEGGNLYNSGFGEKIFSPQRGGMRSGQGPWRRGQR